MGKLLEIETPEGTVLVAARTPEDGVKPVSVRETVIEKVGGSLDDALDVVARVAKSVHRALAKSEVEAATVEFGLQFTGKGTLYVVESEMQAALKITLSVRPR